VVAGAPRKKTLVVERSPVTAPNVIIKAREFSLAELWILIPLPLLHFFKHRSKLGDEFLGSWTLCPRLIFYIAE
jgi:hypothetical protein